MSSGTSTPPPKTEDSKPRESADGGRGKGLIALLGSFFTTLPGLLTGVAALGATFFGGTQLNSQPAPTVTVTATVTASVPARPTVSGSTTTAIPSSAQGPSSDPVTSAAPIVEGTELSTLTALQSSTVDKLTTSQSQEIGNKTYANAVSFSCSDPAAGSYYNELVYQVTGYTTLDATFGVPDGASNGTGNSATITFYRDGGSTRIGNSYTIALDAPAHVDLQLQGMSQLEINCSAANRNGYGGDDIDVAIVNGTLSK